MVIVTAEKCFMACSGIVVDLQEKAKVIMV
jgi:hypothetical protein